MRVLVTGATSVLGRATTRALQRAGHEVVVLQRHRSELGVTEHLGDVRDAGAVAGASRRCDVIIHAAGRVGIVGSRSEFTSVNVGGTANVVDTARRSGQGVVYVSSPAVAHRGHPLVGARATPATTRHTSRYATTKAIAERLVLAARDVPTTAVRPHLVWGPGDTQLIGRIVDRARRGRLVLVDGGSALIDTTYVTNAAEALVAAAEQLGLGGPLLHRPVVVSNGEPRPIAEMVERVCRAAGVPFAPRTVPLGVARAAGSVAERLWRSGEPPITRFLADQLGTAHWFDPREARELLAWEPRVDLEQGFALLEASFDRHGGRAGAAGAPGPA